MLKKFFASGGYTPPAPPAQPRDYYISEDGIGDGLTSGSPAPISILTSATIISNDNIFFNRGDTFDLGGFNIYNIDNIDIDAFGSGANPIILGSHYLAQTFINNGDGTWYVPLADAPLWVTEGDVMLREAESDWIPITANVSAQVRQVNGATIDAFPDSIVGAKMYGKEFEFRLSQELTVTNWDTGTDRITFTGTFAGGAAGMPVKLVGQKQFMTSANDWVYDSVTERLYIKSVSDPTGRNFRIITETLAIYINVANNLTLKNIDFKHYFYHGILINESPNITVESCSFSAIRGNGIRAYGNNTTNLILTGLNISNCGLRGVEIGGVQGGIFTTLNIQDIGVQLNLGFPFDAERTGGTAITLAAGLSSWAIDLPNDITIDHCTLSNLGYQGIHCIGQDWVITNNTIHDYCTKWSDGGAIHLYWNSSVNGATSGNLMQNNIIYNGIGNIDGIVSGSVDIVAGIYFDSGITNNTADSNVVWNAGVYAMWCNDHNNGHIITNNIFHGPLWMRQNTTVSGSFPINNVTNCILTGNTFAVDLSTDRCVVLWNQTGGNWSPFTAGIDNNHYVNPYNVQGNINATSTNGFSFSNYTIATWRTFVSGDALSTSRFNYKTTPDADDILIESNATDIPVNFNVPVGYSDYSGNAFNNPVSIPAHYGLIYFQD